MTREALRDLQHSLRHTNTDEAMIELAETVLFHEDVIVRALEARGG